MDTVQRNFAGGEVAPGLYGRPDTTKVQTGARTMRNMFVRRHGGASNRTGGKFICALKDSATRGRLLKFVFNAEQTYVLLFENRGMRVIQDGVLLAVTPDAWSGATAYVTGDVAVSASLNYYCILAHTNQLPPNATYWYPMPLDGTYEVPSPFLAADLQALYRSQSGDIVTLTHTGYQIYDLSRTGHTTWVFTPITMAPSIAAPATLTNSGAAGAVTQWVVTSVKQETYEESLPSVASGTSAVPTSGAPITLSIATVTGALEFNVYKNEGNGIYGFIGVSSGITFIDNGKVPDFDLTPPAARDPFSAAGDHPACSGYLQQRKSYGGSNNNPETAYLSKTGQYKNFGISSPLRLNDACTYPIASKEVNEVRHLIEVLETFVLTSGVEWVALGGTDGALTPGSPGLKPKSYYGSSAVPPVIIGDNILFIQALGSLVRDLNYDATASKGYTGRDLSVFAPHLFAGKTIEHWDYMQSPDSIVLAQQDDGSMIGLTYLPEHEVWGWFHYDTKGLYEDVVSVPEGTEHAGYYLVNRTINGDTRRYVERFASRRVTDIEVDAIFMDSYLTYDGRNTDETHTMEFTGSGTGLWTVDDEITLVANFNAFTADEVGNAYRLTISTTTWTPENNRVTVTEHLILTITSYVSPIFVTGTPERDVPVAFRQTPMTNWARGVDEFSGMDHLEGESLSILGDGNAIANGIDAPLTTVVAGAFTTEEPHFVLHAGLPYCSDLETLDLELEGGETLASKKKSVNLVTFHVEASRGLFIGEDKDHLREWKQRQASQAYGTPIPLFTGKDTIAIGSTWNTGGRIFLRQKDPLPLTVLNVIPTVSVGG